MWLADYGLGECELRNAEGCFLAGKGAPGVRRSSLKRDMAVERLVYPWDLLDWQERVMRGMEGDGGFIKDGAHVMGTLRLGRDSAVLPGVVVEGCVWVGDGCRVGPNFGAGTVCSNFRHDGAEQRMMAGGRLVETGRNKLGAVIGDHVRFGANTVVLPGRVVSPGTWTMPGEVFR